MSVSSVRAVNGDVYPSASALVFVGGWTHPLLIACEVIVTKPRIHADDMVRRALCQGRMTPRFGILDILFYKGDTQYLATLVGPSTDDRGDTSMQEWVELFKYGRFRDSRFCLVATDIQVLFEILDCRSTLFDTRLEVSVHPQNMLRDLSITLLVRVVRDDKQEIETGQERIGQGNVSVRIFVYVVLAVSGDLGIEQWGGTYLTVDRIGSSDDTTSCVQTGMNTGFCNRNSLLLHDFVNSDSIDFRHFVKFIVTHHTSVSQNHRTSFESPLAWRSDHP